LAALSRWYETDPVPPSGQPPYVNGVALLVRTGTEGHDADGRAGGWTAGSPAPAMTGGSGPAPIDPPATLLAALHAIEAEAFRARSVPNAARTLDLDLIDLDVLVRDAPDPILPHPRAHLRGFVLAPLRDIAPGWVHPRLGRTARDLLAALPPDGARLLPPG
jgi:2-amino-4-hydroxy-6-hydroxymethyldihydropteridine diphosphokinase